MDLDNSDQIPTNSENTPLKERKLNKNCKHGSAPEFDNVSFDKDFDKQVQSVLNMDANITQEITSPKKVLNVQISSESIQLHSAQKKLFLPKKTTADSQSEKGVKNRHRLNSTGSDDSSEQCPKRDEKVHIYKTTHQAFSEVSSGRSTPPKSRSKIRQRIRFIKEPLNEIQEVCENAEHFWEHSKLAFYFFMTATWKILKFIILCLTIKLALVLGIVVKA